MNKTWLNLLTSYAGHSRMVAIKSVMPLLRLPWWVLHWSNQWACPSLVASAGNLVKLNHDCNILSKHKSLAYVDYIPTHCPLLLPIEWLSEIFGLECLLYLNSIGVASDNLDFTLNYWPDSYCNYCTYLIPRMQSNVHRCIFTCSMGKLNTSLIQAQNIWFDYSCFWLFIL